MIDKIYNFLCMIYKKFFSKFENFLYIDKSFKKKKFFFNYKFLSNVNYRNIDYKNFDIIKVNKYLLKVLFPRKVIIGLIKDIFIKEKIAEEITKLTGFKYSIDFFTAYETYEINQNDLNKGWYANHFHKDKPYSYNMLKLFFSFNDITKRNGPMEIKIFDEKNNKTKCIQVILRKNEVFLFKPTTLFHRATSPENGKRFQIMMQLNPARNWSVNSNIFFKQLYREPKFPYFYYFFDKKCALNEIILK